jgi:uncharacterized cupin superfamily protein
MKPVINLDELTLESHAGGPFQGRYGVISTRIGARDLGYNLTVVAPGQKACPFHNHHINEEMFFIIEGEGLLRFGAGEYPLRKHDVVSCPPGKRDVAHQIINTGKSELKYLALSTMERGDICEYPDSNKVGVYAGGEYGNRDIQLVFKADRAVDYIEGES